MRELFLFAPERPTHFPREACAKCDRARERERRIARDVRADRLPPSSTPRRPVDRGRAQALPARLAEARQGAHAFSFPTNWLFFTNHGSRAVPFSRPRARPDARAARPTRASPGARATRYRSRARSRDAPRSISRGRRHARRFVVLGTPGGTDRRLYASRSEIVCTPLILGDSEAAAGKSVRIRLGTFFRYNAPGPRRDAVQTAAPPLPHRR